MSPESGPRIGCHKMRYITLATVAALAVGVAVTTHAGNARMLNGVARPFLSEARPGASSVASLNALLAEWDHAGFNAPGKPGQARVYGREGYVTTDGGYNFMVSLIRSAENDVRVGRDADAARKIAQARNLLTASNSEKG